MNQSIVKITVGASNAIIPTYTAYHYPVYMRNLGIGAGNLAAGFALVFVPYMFLMVSLWWSFINEVGMIKKNLWYKKRYFTHIPTLCPWEMDKNIFHTITLACLLCFHVAS